MQSQLNTLNKQKELTPQDKLVQQDLTQTLETLDKIERIKSETAQLRQQVEQAPAKLRQAVESLNNLSDVPNDDATRKTLSTLCVGWSRASPRRWTICRMRKTIWRPITASWFPCKRSRNACKMRCSTPPAAAADPQSSEWHLGGRRDLRPTQQVLLQAQQALLNAQIEQQRKSLEGNTILQDTLQKQRDYVTAWSRLEHQLQLLEAVNSKRLTLTEKTAQEAVTPDETARIQANPLVKQELDINHQLSEKLIQATENGNQLVQRNIQVKNWLDRALPERDIKEQISVLGACCCRVFFTNSNRHYRRRMSCRI